MFTISHCVKSSYIAHTSCAVILSLLLCGGVFAEEPQKESRDESALAEMSIEDLMNVEVTSVSKKKEKMSEASAAISVITQDDIRRSGATTIAELLRTVPGLDVARLDANKWSVSSRGMSGRFANKMLVLIDGRSVYTPLFAGVYWENQDLPLEDIERIEIIRGPGSTAWGANAVNGVINIVTKKAADTQGGMVTAGVGTEDRGFGSLRVGGKAGDDLYYRIFGKYADRDAAEFESGEKAEDGWDIGSGGFRIDWDADENDAVTIEGGGYVNDTTSTATLHTLRPPYQRRGNAFEDFRGANVLSRWTHTYSEESNFDLQIYYDHAQARGTILNHEYDTYDIDFQRRFPVGGHDIVWGLGYRYMSDSIGSTPYVRVDPENGRFRIFSGFIQDQILLLDDKLHVAFGAKLEYNDFTGLEVQPNVRLAWTPNSAQTLWAAVSRAVRSPSRVEFDGYARNISVPRVLAVLRGNHDFESEELLAYELGYRIKATETVSLEVATFYNRYDGLRTIELGRPYVTASPLPVRIELPFRTKNNMDADTYGVELGVDWRPQSWWRMQFGYTYLEMDVNFHPRSIDILSGSVEGESPEQQFYWQHAFDLPHHVELDLTLRYVDTLPSLNVDEYITLDARVGWKPSDTVEIAIVGQNLLESTHQEYDSKYVDTAPTWVERSVYGKITWQF